MDLQYILKAENESGVEGVEYVTDRLGVMVPYLSILVAAMVTGTIGNVLVILAVVITKELRTVGNFFICNLALTDLMVACLANVFNVISSLEGASWYDDLPGLCVTLSVLCFGACACSLNTICVIAINRYINICHFQRYSDIFTKWKTVAYTVILWVLSVVETSSTVILADHGFDQKAMSCIWDRTVSFGFNIGLSSMVIGIPVVVTAICYLKIYLFVSRQSKRVAAMATASNKPSDKKETKQKTASGQSKSAKIARTLFAIYIVFLLCWTPYLLCLLIDVHDSFPAEVHLFTLLFAHVNSSCNCVVYGITNAQFRKGYVRVLSKLPCITFLSRQSGPRSHDLNHSLDTTQDKI